MSIILAASAASLVILASQPGEASSSSSSARSSGSQRHRLRGKLSPFTLIHSPLVISSRYDIINLSRARHRTLQRLRNSNEDELVNEEPHYESSNWGTPTTTSKRRSDVYGGESNAWINADELDNELETSESIKLTKKNKQSGSSKKLNLANKKSSTKSTIEKPKSPRVASKQENKEEIEGEEKESTSFTLGQTKTKTPATTGANKLLTSKNKQLMYAAGKSAALVLAPSIESIAMRLVSAAASKSAQTNGRSAWPSTSSSSPSSTLTGGRVQTLKQSGSDHHSPSSSSPLTSATGLFPHSSSFLSTLSSNLLSSAMSSLINFSNSTQLTPTPTANHSPLATSWPNKLTPLLYSLASLSGLSDLDSHSSASLSSSTSGSHLLPSPPSSSSSSSSSSSALAAASQSFLTDLATAASGVSSTSATSSSANSNNLANSIRPHTSKQHSPTMVGMINLARYVLCKYYICWSAKMLNWTRGVWSPNHHFLSSLLLGWLDRRNTSRQLDRLWLKTKPIGSSRDERNGRGSRLRRPIESLDWWYLNLSTLVFFHFF